MPNKTKFILFTVAMVVVVIGLGLYFGLETEKPGKFDVFAKALTEKGAHFYGAFSCSHCQTQKTEFGSSQKYLPYVECSNPNNTQKEICKENQIEAYPTWTFKEGIKLSSISDPIICPVDDKDVVQEGICANISSKFNRVWLFPFSSFSIKSPADPIREGNNWQFPSGSQAIGELSQSFLAEQIEFVLPQ